MRSTAVCAVPPPILGRQAQFDSNRVRERKWAFWRRIELANDLDDHERDILVRDVGVVRRCFSEEFKLGPWNEVAEQNRVAFARHIQHTCSREHVLLAVVVPRHEFDRDSHGVTPKNGKTARAYLRQWLRLSSDRSSQAAMLPCAAQNALATSSTVGFGRRDSWAAMTV